MYRILLLVLIQLTLSNFSEALTIIQKPIELSITRVKLTEEYALIHYGKAVTVIQPQAVVIHWTASSSLESTYKYFFKAVGEDGTLNVASHFLVDRDGTVYQLTSETTLNKHAIGYNWSSIGIENVGGLNDIENLTAEQLTANVELIRYLKNKFPTIEYVFGHYQQDIAKDSGLYLELINGYYADKVDPGKKFMSQLRNILQDEFIFYPE